ncbi:MAG TPA: hypothetical protein DCR46_06710 [Cytophagales bacterium]|nr:hypothetical protein [Cytophagales bacterium]
MSLFKKLFGSKAEPETNIHKTITAETTILESTKPTISSQRKTEVVRKTSQNPNTSSVIDIPRGIIDNNGVIQLENDLFGINNYEEALIDFIHQAETPLTIALQGEWGSGKTSLMNTMHYKLCGNGDNAKFYSVWINSWQYSLMKTPEEAVMKIVAAIIEQIALKNGTSGKEKFDEAKKILKNIGVFMAKQVVDKIGGNADYVGDFFENGDEKGAEISKLKGLVEEEIEKVLNKPENNKKGFIFYIDDLDRIDPPAAVNILELLKNIFDIENCIFILAIDYDVIVKGLVKRFGPLTEKNEREFRCYFDKIIQLPFKMPVSNYKIDDFLENTLPKIGYISQDDFKNVSTIYSKIALWTVGPNPRSLKRLVNTLSFINIINNKKNKINLEKDEKEIAIDKQISFFAICLQLAYPTIYSYWSQNPNFVAWNDDLATKLDLPLDEKLQKLTSTAEFDENWEQVLYRMCLKDIYTSSRSASISQLFNLILNIIPKDDEGDLDNGRLQEKLQETAETSSVTSLQAKTGEIESNDEFSKVPKKEKLDLLKTFGKELFDKMYERNQETVPDYEFAENTRWANFYIAPIYVKNPKYDKYRFHLYCCNISWEDISILVSIEYKDPNKKYFDWSNKVEKEKEFFKETKETLKKIDLRAKRPIMGFLSSKKFEELNFTNLTPEMLKLLNDPQKKSALIERIVNESLDMIEKTKTAFDS